VSSLRVALDVTPLLAPPTGIHQVTRGLLDALSVRDDIELHGWLLTARGDRPSISIPVRRSRIPAAFAVRGWARSTFPPGRLVAGRADVVHGTNFLAPPTPRSVISLQDLTPLSYPQWCEPGVAAMVGPLRNAIRRGATVHVSSGLVRDEALAELRIEPDRVRLVHHAVRPIHGGDASLGRALAGSDRYVLVLGTVEQRKNVIAAVRATAELPPDVRLVVVGPAGNAEEALAASIRQVGSERVVRLPAVDASTRDSLIRGAVALAWPSRYEGFAVPPLEALSVGTPVVATAVGALPELIGDSIPLIAPGDDDAFAAALVAAVASPPPIPERVREAISELTWDRSAAAMVEVYRDVAGV
jgi:glycosyltransferase involved in cell wall biosynthesis